MPCIFEESRLIERAINDMLTSMSMSMDKKIKWREYQNGKLRFVFSAKPCFE